MFIPLFSPIYYNSKDTLDCIDGDSYSAIVQLKNTDIFFVCKNYGRLNQLFNRGLFCAQGFDTRILCVKKYNVIDPTIVIESYRIHRPVDLFYYKYRASISHPYEQCNHSMEDYIITVTGAVPIPIDDFD